MTDATDTLARQLAESAVALKDGTTRRPVLTDPRTDALIRGIANGFAPVIRDFVREQTFKDSVPIKAALENLEARLADLERRTKCPGGGSS
jgi:hypothetical protein